MTVFIRLNKPEYTVEVLKILFCWPPSFHENHFTTGNELRIKCDTVLSVQSWKSKTNYWASTRVSEKVKTVICSVIAWKSKNRHNFALDLWISILKKLVVRTCAWTFIEKLWFIFPIKIRAHSSSYDHFSELKFTNLERSYGVFSIFKQEHYV